MLKKVRSLIALCLFFFLTEAVISSSLFFDIDKSVFYFVASLRNVAVTKILLIFTYLGDWYVLLFLAFFVLLFFLYLKKINLVYILSANLILAWLVQFILKLIIKHPRPDIEWALIGSNNFSFPSGHAIMSFVFFTFCGFYLYKKFLYQWQKNLIVIFFSTLIFLVGFSRVYLGVHWPSDVIAGWLLGAALFFYSQSAFERNADKT